MAQVIESEGLWTVRVELANDPYPVLVGEGLLQQAGGFLREQVPSLRTRCAIVTDSTVGPLYAERLSASLVEHGFEPTVLEVPAGEASKSMEEATRICRALLRAGLDRNSFVLALGGGVVGDLAGFCAALFQRGIPYIQIPTTIVSLVDSSVGGKTGVNTPEGKNLLGAFHQPALVLADADTLKTLPKREYAEGFAEIIKHATIRDPDMLEEVVKFRESSEGIAPLIARNVAIKAAIVEADAQERSGTRALLNFGHTIGHGIESAAGYGTLLHGEAISLGTRAALQLSTKLCGLPTAQADRVMHALKAFDLPLRLDPSINTETVLEKMARDKKFEEGKIRFVLLRSLGDAHVSHEVTMDLIQEQIEQLREGLREP